MNDRLRKLELEHGIPAPSVEPEEKSILETQEEVRIQPESEPVPVPESVEVVRRPVVEQWTGIQDEYPPPVKARPVKAESTGIKREWEQILGGNWLARIGVLSLIFGTGFFLKFAFDRDWLGPLGRIILGVVGGLLMLGAGHFWHKKYPVFAQAVSGGGIAVLYLSIFAAYAAFDLISFIVSVIVLFCVSALSAIISLRYNSMALAVIGIIGAFLAPFILAVFAFTGSGNIGTTSGIWLMIYVFIVDIGVLWLSTFRNWRWFNLLAFTGSILIYSFWLLRYGDDTGLPASLGSLTVLFVIFNAVTTLYHALWKRIPGSADYLLMLLNVAAYYGLSYAILSDGYREWCGGFTFILAALYGGLAWLFRKKTSGTGRLPVFALGIALLMFTVAIPVQIGDRAWVTVAWSVEGALLMWISFRAGLPKLRLAGYLSFIAAIIRLVYFDRPLKISLYTPVLNERFLAFIVSALAVYFTCRLFWKKREELTEYEISGRFNYRIFFTTANFISLCIIAAEILSFTDNRIAPGREWLIALLVPLACIIVLYPVLWKRSLALLDLFLLIINAITFLVLSILLGSDFHDWAGLVFLLPAIIYGVLAVVIHRRHESNTCFIAAVIVSLVTVNIAFAVQFGDRLWLTLVWAVEAVALIWASFRTGIGLFRYFSYPVFVAVIIRLLFFESHVVVSDFTPFINQRFLAFILGIAAMYLAAFLLNRYREKLPEKERTRLRMYAVFLIAANLFTVVIFSIELWGYFSREIIEARLNDVPSIKSARNLSLTAIWAVYSIALLILGIVRRSRYLRLSGLALFVIPILKVYVFDVFALEQLYRIFAFTGLGILLVISGYLYNRYKDAIRGFIREQ